MSKKAVKKRTYRTIASVKICDGESVLLLDDLKNKINRARKVLSQALKIHSDIKLTVTGLEDSRLEEIQILNSEGKSIYVVDDLADATVELVLDSPQFELDSMLIEEKLDFISHAFKKDLTTSVNLANTLANESATAQEFNQKLKDIDREECIRKLISCSSGDKVNVKFEDGTEYTVGGHLPLSKHLPHEEHIAIKDCRVTEALKNGIVKISEKGVKKPLELQVNSEDIKIFLLSAAVYFGWNVSCKLMPYDKLADAKVSYKLIALEGENLIMKRIIEEMQSRILE